MELELKQDSKQDETERLLSNPVNVKHLNESIKQAEEGKLTPVKIEDLWK